MKIKLNIAPKKLKLKTLKGTNMQKIATLNRTRSQSGMEIHQNMLSLKSKNEKMQ
jgi:hypothetical protein